MKKYQFAKDMQEFLDEFQELRNNLDKALNYALMLQKEKAAILACVRRGDIDLIKEQFLCDGDGINETSWEQQKAHLNDWSKVLDNIQHMPIGFLQLEEDAEETEN